MVQGGAITQLFITQLLKPWLFIYFSCNIIIILWFSHENNILAKKHVFVSFTSFISFVLNQIYFEISRLLAKYCNAILLILEKDLEAIEDYKAVLA